MIRLRHSLRRRRDRRGQGQTEYGLAVVLIAIFLIGAVYYFGQSTASTIEDSGDAAAQAVQQTEGGGGGGDL